MSNILFTLGGMVLGFLLGWLTLGLCIASKKSEEDKESDNE